MKLISIFTIVLSLLMCITCRPNSNKLSIVMYKAGSNGSELQKTINHFIHNKNLNGLKCALFLIENMGGKYWVDEDNKKILDIHSIKAIDLINNIERALEYKSPDTDWGIFYEYVLPHRVAHEPFVDWRNDCINRYSGYKSKHVKRTTQLINDKLKLGFKFSNQGISNNSKSWFDLIKTKTGNCWAMAYSVLYPLRAIGIPVTVDYVTGWGNINGGSHAWNVLITGKKTFIPFMGCETSPPDYNPFAIYREKRLPIKIYRVNYSSNLEDVDRNSLFDLINEEKAYDVTKLYTTVYNLNISVKGNVDTVYLSVISNGVWEPISQTTVFSGRAIFKNMTPNSVYLPVKITDGINLPVSHPFVMKDNQVKYLEPNFNNKVDIKIETLQSKALDEFSTYSMALTEKEFAKRMNDIHENKYMSIPMDGSFYKLYYWNYGWVLHSVKEKKRRRKLLFKNVPSNGAYRITEDSILGTERLFTYNKGEQTWW